MLKVWTFSWAYVGVYGTRPNAIRYICVEDVKRLFLLDLFEIKHMENCYLYDAESLPVQVIV